MLGRDTEGREAVAGGLRVAGSRTGQTGLNHPPNVLINSWWSSIMSVGKWSRCLDLFTSLV